MDDPHHAANVSSSWAGWLAENAGRFLLYAKQQTRCGADAEDVLQEALVEAWKRVGGVPDAALVYATIRRRAIDLFRQTDRRARREEAVAVKEDTWFDSSVEDRETMALLERGLRGLPDAYREAITLKIWGGLSFSQIAETLGIPQGTASSRYRLGMEQLRKTVQLADEIRMIPL